MKVNFMILNESVVLNFEGQTHTIPNTDKRYARVIQAIKAGQLDAIPELVDITRSLEGMVEGMELRDGLLYDNGEALPAQLSDRILRFRDEGLTFAPLFKFWANLKQNPSFNSRLALYKFLEHNGHPLTEEGEFIAYRGVTEDFKDKHTKTFDNAPGAVCEMPREKVDDNPNNTCSHGLHVACFEYAKSFGEKLVEVKVNPKDVVTVPTDYNGTKMRVCRFEVVQEVQEMNTQELYGTPSSPKVEMAEDEHEEEEHEEEEEESWEEEEEEEEESEERFCQHCGHEVDEADHFCRHCGKAL